MESERGIIIVGHCRVGKHAMMQQLLKERCVLIGVDFNVMSSAVAGLNMSFCDATIAIKNTVDSINENTIVYEKQQSKFISRPRNNFRTK